MYVLEKKVYKPNHIGVKYSLIALGLEGWYYGENAYTFKEYLRRMA